MSQKAQMACNSSVFFENEGFVKVAGSGSISVTVQSGVVVTTVQ